jgi:hypothetical protein
MVVGHPETGHKTDSRKSVELVTPATGDRVKIGGPAGPASWVKTIVRSEFPGTLPVSLSP